MQQPCWLLEPPQEESQSTEPSEQSSLLAKAGLQRQANAAHVQNALSDDETKP